MKKVISILLAVVLAFGLCACGNTKDDPQSDTGSETANSEQVKQKTSSKGDVLHDDENAKVVFESIEFVDEGADGSYMYVVLTVENKTNDTLKVSGKDASVNSFTATVSEYHDIEAKQTDEVEIDFDRECIGNTNIKTLDDVKEIAFVLTLWNEEFTVDIDVPVCLYPHEDREYSLVGHELQEGEQTLIDNETATVIYKHNSVNGSMVDIEFYAYNKTDKELFIALSQVKVGQSPDGALPDYISVLPQKELHDTFSIFSDAETIKSAADISFVVEFLDTKNYQPIFTTESFTCPITK